MVVDQEFGESLVLTLTNRAHQLHAAVECLRALSYPSEGPRRLASFLSECSETLVAELSALRGKAYRDVEQTALRKGLLLTILHSILEFVATAETQRVPGPLVAPLEALVRSYVPDSLIIVRFTWHFNYYSEELAEGLREILRYEPALMKLADRLPRWLAVFSFPLASKDDILIHGAFAHEVGHFIGRVRGLHKKLGVEIGPRMYEVRAELQTQLVPTIQRWYGEVIADVIGTCLFGPACFLAFGEVVLHALNEPGPTHPAPITRLGQMLLLLRELGYLDKRDNQAGSCEGQLPASYRAFFETYQAFLTTTGKAPAEGFFGVVTESVLAVWAQIRQEATRVLDPPEREVSAVVAVIESLSERLRLLVPPDEYELRDRLEVPRLPDVLNAGWLAYSVHRAALEHLLGASGPGRELTVRRKLTDIMSKAIESTVIKQRWQRVRQHLGEKS